MSLWPGDFFFPHQVAVRDLTGSGGMGSTFGPPRTLAAEVKDEQSIVRAADGSEVVSSTNVTVELPQHVPLGSLVTVWPGGASEREAEVLAVERDENAAPLPSYLILKLK